MSSSSPASCDELIDEIWHEIVVNDHSHANRFISHERLRNSLSPNRAQALLQCVCTTCKKHRAEVPAVEDLQLRNWVLASAPKLFSLLSYSGCTQLIRAFYKDYHDAAIEKTIQLLDANVITRKFRLPKFQRLAERVEENRYKFFVPTLSDRARKANQIQVFDAKTILPFINQEKIGHGAFGHVYAFQLLEEYGAFENLNTHIPLVRKEIDEDDVFPDELPILLHVRELKNKHIVRLVTAYKHGNKLNFIFPRARTNLRQYFREPKPVVPGISLFYIEQHPIWRQMLAVIEVLYQIYAESYHASSGKQIKLYHFDLKPENILVDQNSDGLMFLVSDFGLSRAQHGATRAGFVSRVTGCPGTAAYAPPEVYNSDHHWNHRYDVYSLGCVLLEVCAYVVGGPQGVAMFEKTKFTQIPAAQEIRDDNIWQFSRPGEAEMKPQVRNWIRGLPKTTNAGDAISSMFLTRILELAVEMLDVDASRRLDAEAACSKLESILRKTNRLQSSGSSYTDIQSECSSSLRSSVNLVGSVPVGLGELEGCQQVNCRYFNKQYQGAEIRLYEDDVSVLRLELRTNSTESSIVELGPRKWLSVIPSPALGNQTQNRLIIHLTRVRDSRAGSVRINLAAPKDTATLQSVLMGQAVRSISNSFQKSLEVKNLKIETFNGRVKSRLTSKSKSKPLPDLHGTPTALQFWMEKDYRDLAAWAKIRPRRSSPRFVFDVPIRRLVIFCKKAMITIRLGKNVRLKKGKSMDGKWYQQLIPTDDSTFSNDPSFAVSILTSSYKGYLTAPLDKEELISLEEQATYECSLVQLGFNTEEDSDAFRRRYQTLKEDLKKEHDNIQKLKEKGAEQRGWAPNSTAV